MQINKILHTGLLCAFVFLLFSFPLLAQKSGKNSLASLSGRITSSDGEPVPGITIILKSTAIGTTTDASGGFELKDIRPGNHVVEITAVGYFKITETISFTSGQQVVKKFSLKEENKELDEVQVIGKTENQQVREQGFTVNAIETKKFANTTADLNQVLSRSTGVRVREQGGLGSDFNFSVNGLSGQAIRFFIDGVPIETMGSSMTLNNIPVNLAERVEVYKGVVPVNLGSDALGGAVNIITNQKVRNFLDASYSYGSFNTHRAAATGQWSHAKTGIIFKASAFYNFSDNNYLMKDISLWNADQYAYIPTDVRRFHDTFKSGMVQLEAGVVNKKWADVLFVGGSFSGSKKDIQTGAYQDAVYGKLFTHGHAYSGTVRYHKDNLLIKGLNVNAFGSYVVDNYEVVDTSYVRYSWDGSFVKTSLSELNGARTLNNIKRPKLFVRGNASYEISSVHSFNLNYTLDRTTNQLYDAYANTTPTNDLMSKRIVGLAYQQNLIGGKLSNTAFMKYYGTKFRIEQQVGYVSGTNSDGNGSNNNLGYGIASRFKVAENLGFKASFEKAYRLQTAAEMLGDGINQVANYDLKPENSRNINLGGYYGHRFDSKHRIFAEAGWFYRDVKDFIYAVVLLTAQTQYKNTSAVKVTGWEGEVKYSYSNLLDFTVNASYQNAINNTSFFEGKRDITYLNKIPNQPWIFGNADFNIGKNDLIGKNTRLQFNWYTQYVHWFYRTWEALGNPDGKAKIPSQLIHNAALTYSLQNGKYNISVESKNLTDALAFDNFRLQKPGRSFYVKLRMFLR